MVQPRTEDILIACHRLSALIKEKQRKIRDQQTLATARAGDILSFREQIQDPTTDPYLRSQMKKDLEQLKKDQSKEASVIGNLKRELDDLENDFFFRGCDAI